MHEHNSNEEQQTREPLGMSGTFKCLSIFYGAFLTRSAKIRTADRKKIDLADSNCCKELTLVRSYADLYHDISTVTHIFVVLYFSLLKSQLQDKNSENYQYVKCYTPRIVLGQYVDPGNCLIIGTVLSSMHLIYRFLVRIYRKEFEIDLISFVATSEDTFKECLIGGNSVRDFWPCAILDPTVELMYYRFRDPLTGLLELRLRPNRDDKTRRQLFRFVGKIHAPLLIGGALISSAYFIVGFISLIYYQDEIYDNCRAVDPNSWSIAYLARNLLSGQILFVCCLDHFMGLMFSIMTSPVLIYDLNRYREKLMQQIHALIENLSALVAHETEQSRATRASADASGDGGDQFAPISQLKRGGGALMMATHLQATRDIADLQNRLVDFFGQVRRADSYVSLVTPFSIFVWLVCNAILTLSGMQLESSFRSTAIRFFQVTGFLMAGTISNVVLEFKRRVEQTYVPLCTMMALDPTSNKARWLPIMSFFTHRPRHAFTLFGARIYTRLAYLSYISYTFTFVLFVENVRFNRTVGSIAPRH